MRKCALFLVACLVVSLVSACGKRDSIMMVKSPTDGVYYTIEVSKAIGLASDTTRVYAHLQRNGKTRKILVLSGEDLTVTRITWKNPHDATICLDGGITDTFRNEVTLIVGDGLNDSESIHNHLDEHCSGVPAPAAPPGS
jgi:hypothetical protein